MKYTQFMMVSAFMEQLLNDYNKYYANHQRGKANYVQGMIHGVYTAFQLCDGKIRITQTGTDKDGNPTQFYELTMDYRSHRIHRFMKTGVKK